MKYPDDFINKIICGDCLEAMKDIPDKSIDLVLTDPPYGVDLEYDIYKDTEENFLNLMKGFIPEAKRVAKMTIFPFVRIGRMKWLYNNFEPDWWIVWDKGSPGIRCPIGFNDYELLAVYGKNNPTNMHDIFRQSNIEAKGNYGHPCPKSVKWAEWLISRASKEGDTILDPFIGSGTTAVAAKRLKRNYIGIEISPEYCKIAEERIRTQTKPLF